MSEYDVEDNKRTGKPWVPYEDAIVRAEYYSACKGKKKPQQCWELIAATKLQRSPQGIRSRMSKQLLPVDEGRPTYEEVKQSREAAFIDSQKRDLPHEPPAPKQMAISDQTQVQVLLQLMQAMNNGFEEIKEAITRLSSIVEEAWTDKK